VFDGTVGMNEKAGMNEEELEKFIYTNIVRLFPDVQDATRKRVILKVDSGPGRMNVKMLARLRCMGIYVVPGVPNTTEVSQEMDQLYGLFKSLYRENLRALALHRQTCEQPINMTDIPLIIFGRTVTGKNKANGKNMTTTLRDAFAESFSKEKCKACWEKVGAVPLTRHCLKSEGVRHELVVDENGVIDMDGNPTAVYLQSLEAHNKLCCDILLSNGFDSNPLRKKAPVIKKDSATAPVTVPMSRERQDAIQNARTAGQLFHATKGDHIGTDDFFGTRAS
jgi:hypothetical protein